MSSATGVRLTMKINSAQLLRTSGWSENIDLGYADLATANDNILKIKALIALRCQCLGIGAVMVSAVASAFVQPTAPGARPLRRNTMAIEVPTFPGAGTAYNKAFIGKGYTADFSPTVYYIGLQTILSGTPVYRRSYWLACLPDVADETDTVAIADPVTLPSVEAYMNAIKNKGNSLSSQNSCSIRSVDRSGGNAVKLCTAWNVDVNTYTVPAHGFVVNQPVLAEGMVTIKGGTAPRGRYLIRAVLDANTISLQGAKTPTAPVKLGGFRAAIQTFNVIADSIGFGFTKRDKGRPSGQSVGRRRKPATTPA